MVSLILTCAGKGSRAGFNENKIWELIDGQTVVDKALCTFSDSGLIDQIVITANETDFEKLLSLYGDKHTVVLGGSTRTQSVINALSLVTGDVVLIHDGARPFVSNKIIADCIECAQQHGSAIPVFPTRDTMLVSDGNVVNNYLGKSELYAVQTPQGFNTNHIKDAYARVGDKTFNDDGEVYQEFIGDLHVYQGETQNVKLTYPEDFKSKAKDCRFGVGFDCHRLVENRALILGGVTIPHDKGLLGHSDADVLTHAIMDAILSALALRDIGYHFSDKDPTYKDACSMNLLQRVLEMIDEKGYKVKTVSASIMAEKPKLLKHIPNVTKNLANALTIDERDVGITATTLEGLGFVGREEGICVHATAVLIEK